MDILTHEIKNITITPEILQLIAEIDEFKGRWKVRETLAPEKLTSRKRIATIESVGSSTRIEGAKLSDREVESCSPAQTIRKQRQNWEYWLVFFLKTMAKQKDNLAAKVKEEQTLRASLPALSRQILELAKTRDEIMIKEIEESTGANCNTIKVHVKKLANDSYLAQVGKGRGARYTLRKFRKLALCYPVIWRLNRKTAHKCRCGWLRCSYFKL